MTDNPQIELARRYVEQTNVSLFLTGKAGTGKTTFLRDIDTHCAKRHVVVAPTGVAAVNAGGVTIHSFFQLPFDPYLPDIKELVTEYQMPESRKTLNKTKLNIIRTLELLIIDEISMVRADLLDAIDMTLRRYRRSSRPFGGVQLLMIGDVHQLSPVVTERERPFMERVYPSPFFFNSKALQRTNYTTIELTTVYRQQDAAFVELLNRVRNNQLDADTLNSLNSRVQSNTQTIKQSNNQAITLTTHNRQADAINRHHMEALTGPSHMMQAKVEGNFPESAMPLEQLLEVKVGERVMFVKNDSSGARRYYNGKLATVTDIVKGENCDLIEVIDDEGDTIVVGREQWENVRYDIGSDGSIKQVVDGTFTQYPLRPAWAVTIHKAQGLTFDRVVIDATDAFAFGQVYVALSRCRTLEGLTLSTPLSSRVAFGNNEVEHFVGSQPCFETVREQASQCEAQYYIEQLTELFSGSALAQEAERLEEAYSRLKNIYPENVETMKGISEMLAELASVGEKFAVQLMRLPFESHPARISAACQYYLPKLSLAAARLSGILDVDIDNKENKKSIADSSERVNELLAVKIACLRTVMKEGFDIVAVQKAKTEALIGGSRKTETEKRRASARRGGSATNAPLLEMLTAWRRKKAEELETQAFKILQQKALVGIAVTMPTSKKELLAVPGIGNVIANRFGKELLDIVADYREAYGIR